MYKLSVPFMLHQIDTYGADAFIAKLKEIGADIVFLALDCYKLDKGEQAKVFDSLKENVPLFQKAGFTVGVWVWTFMVREKNDFVHITSPNGGVCRDQVCPSDKDFCKFAYEYMQNIAESRPDMIMFDDDFRYGFLDGGLGCTCKHHRALMEELLGEPLPAENLGKLIFGGGPNKYRSAYLRANGHFFREFAKQSRAAVDSVDPAIRLGLCSCMTTWDFDGVSTAELAHILAGNTKPFCRLIGAPYWAVKQNWGNRLQDVIELSRMESAWCDDDIEIFAEGDAYPRPRFICPSNFLEGYDMALRASGAVDGIHKYTLDYTADVDYEPGYNRKHLKNQAIYQQIDAHFADKTPVGVRVYEQMAKFENMDVPYYHDGMDSVENMFFSPAARMLAAQTIPTIYEGLGTVGIAFGENAKYLDAGALENGLILDVSAAKILEKAGIDAGLSEVGGIYSAGREYFPDKKRYVNVSGCPAAEIAVKPGAKVLSFFDGDEKIASYAYENAAGQKFLVFAFDGYSMSEHAFRQYARGEEIEGWIASIGKTLPASMHGNPDCYMLCKESESGKAVWIGNFFADECLYTTVALDRTYSEIRFINCTGTLDGNTVTIDAIPPYASVGFEVN
ncbi:MAG: hypothetical protein E7632_09100 [Ruminococcaceae bacterium]|nr:hypothetical protein [Oscillospiraceae bacterium]